MNIKTIMVAAAVCGCISLAKAADEVAKAEKGETEEKEDTLVSAEGYLGVDSRYMTYGLIDGKDPIARLNAYVTFFDWWYIGGEVLTDLTKGNGKRGGYGNRAGKLMTLDAQTGLAHEFNLGKTLGRLNIDFYFTYEYLPRHHGSMNDTDYLDVEFKLPDLWFEPRLWIERDLMLDEGTYVNLEVGHTFPLIGEGENATLTIKPSVAQGFGNTQRVRGYLYRDRGGEEPLDHGGLMDSTIKCELEWAFCDNLKLAAYVAYSDYWLDREMRHGARNHNASWGHGNKYATSWNFYGGVGVKFSF